MRFNNSPAAEIPAAPQIVVNIIDHLPREAQLAVAAQQDHAGVELWAARDGWVLARVYDSWQHFHVFLKFDARSLQYQCNCPDFRMQAPVPCAHIALALLGVTEGGLFEDPEEFL